MHFSCGFFSGRVVFLLKRLMLRIMIRMHASALLDNLGGPAAMVELEGIFYFTTFIQRNRFILLISASWAVLHVLVWLAHVRLKCYLNWGGRHKMIYLVINILSYDLCFLCVWKILWKNISFS